MRRMLAAFAGVGLALTLATGSWPWGNLTLTAECAPDEATFAWRIDLPSENNFNIDWSFNTGFAAFLNGRFCLRRPT